jgi:hypothetical protein
LDNIWFSLILFSFNESYSVVTEVLWPNKEDTCSVYHLMPPYLAFGWPGRNPIEFNSEIILLGSRGTVVVAMLDANDWPRGWDKNHFITSDTMDDVWTLWDNSEAVSNEKNVQSSKLNFKILPLPQFPLREFLLTIPPLSKKILWPHPGFLILLL